MIVHKITKGPIIRPELPDTNWTNDDENYFVVPDGSELANKIIENCPYYEFVVEDGVLLDIEPTERPAPTPPEPTIDEYLLDLDFRLSLIELGIGGGDTV